MGYYDASPLREDASRHAVAVEALGKAELDQEGVPAGETHVGSIDDTIEILRRPGEHFLTEGQPWH